MKKFFSILLKILGGLMLLAIIIVGIAFYSTSGIVDVADAFFQAVKEKNISKAHSYLAEEFKATTDEAALNDFLTKGAILNYKEASWDERSTNNGRGELSGTITTDTGGTIPIKMAFTKEKDAWKIYTIEKPTAGLQSSTNNTASNTPTTPTSPTLPSKTEQAALVSQAIHDFAISVNAKSMEHFRQTIAKLWQEQFTTKQLDQAYASLIKADINLSILDNLEPTIENEAKLDEKGWIALKGTYPTKPSKVYFEQSYTYENGAWKLTEFNINIK